MNIKLYSSSDQSRWDAYVKNHPLGTHCHLASWGQVIENAYQHKCYYLMAEDSNRVVGILPMVHLNSLIFGNSLVSMPFLNYGGMIADNPNIQKALWEEAINVAKKIKASYLEIRHSQPLSWIKKGDKTILKTHKVSMLLDLPSSSDQLMKSFKSKLRSQIKRPQKEGMTAIIGGKELIDSFYKVFTINMRDLGSPVHSKRLFWEIFQNFSESAQIGVVFWKHQPVASGIVLGFKDTMEIPWASSLRKFNHFSPNMLLYWSFLEYASNSGYKKFDFGRTTPGSGTYRFKKQWGTKPSQLYWYYWISEGLKRKTFHPDHRRFSLAISCWKKMPVAFTRLIGPQIRKYIAL